MNILKSKGYKVLRSSGSHTPIIDIFAAKSNRRLAIQVKKSEKVRMTKEEGQELLKWANLFGSVAVQATKEVGKWVFQDVAFGIPFEI